MQILFAVDSLYATVTHDLSSRYCPTDKTVFLGRLGILIAAFAGVALLLLLFAKFRTQNAQRREMAYMCACAFAVFAIGGGILTLIGLSGCGGEAEAGLIWEWPW